ncbi:VanZ family protein [Desulfovibrio mangrovi]|uniref:VanZ family protein n=1 Tax=Desulfovibrio mangrovi TaxID=2976983 RepID=UPI002246016E|nr:VanZ family protein [Desulfovibrio mangrovi]UZP66866.1 VanZ family protein [Desulfovibrio mangrovi]
MASQTPKIAPRTGGAYPTPHTDSKPWPLRIPRAAVTLLAILSLTTLCFLYLNPSTTPGSELNQDKGYHAIAFGWVTFVLNASVTGRNRRLLIPVVVMILGLCLEGLQSIIPGRLASWADVLANVIGVMLGQYLWSRFYLVIEANVIPGKSRQNESDNKRKP